MKKVSLREILMSILRLILVFAIGTTIVVIVLFVSFDNTKAFNYIFSSKSPADVVWFVVATYIGGTIVGILMLTITCCSALSLKNEELAKCKNEINQLKEKVNKKRPQSPKQKILHEIEDFGCSSVPDSEEDDAISLDETDLIPLRKILNTRTEQDN